MGSTQDLYQEDDCHFYFIPRDDVSVAHCEHGGAGEVDAVDVFGEGGGSLFVDAFEPVGFVVEQGD